MSNELNQADQQALDAVLAKPVTELTEADRALLRARRSYLTQAQREKYLDDTSGDDSAPDETTSDSTADASGDGESVDYETLSYKELVALAKERGVKANGKAEDIIARLTDADAAAQAADGE